MEGKEKGGGAAFTSAGQASMTCRFNTSLSIPPSASRSVDKAHESNDAQENRSAGPPSRTLTTKPWSTRDTERTIHQLITGLSQSVAIPR